MFHFILEYLENWITFADQIEKFIAKCLLRELWHLLQLQNKPGFSFNSLRISIMPFCAIFRLSSLGTFDTVLHLELEFHLDNLRNLDILGIASKFLSV